MIDQQEKWRDGLAGEVSFWELFRSYHPDWFAWSLDMTTPLDSDVDAALEEIPHPIVTVMDVGCGMMSGMGHVSKTDKQVVFAYADPLAMEFDRIAHEQGFVLPHKITQVCSEYLHTSFQPATFDVIYCRNALDHTFHPLTALREMETLLVSGGTMVLKHYVRCGQRNDYQSLHQWDLFDDGGKFYIAWNREVVPINTVLAQSTCKQVERYTEGPETLVKAIYRKN